MADVKSSQFQEFAEVTAKQMDIANLSDYELGKMIFQVMPVLAHMLPLFVQSWSTGLGG